MININTLDLKYSWTAIVKQNNGQIVTIWHTAWLSSKHIIKEIISISSDYPKHLINKS